MTILE
jgi:DNA-binding LytR/AlgR family response regulator